MIRASGQRLAWAPPRRYGVRTVEDQTDTDATPTTRNVGRHRTLLQEAQKLASDLDDRAEIAVIRALLTEPLTDAELG